MFKLGSALASLAVAVLLAACGSSSSSSSSSSSTSSSSSPSTSGVTPTRQLGFEGVPLEIGADIAPAATTAPGTVDGIQCGSSEQLAYHIHAHLTVYAGSQLRVLPPGIGIPGSQSQSTPQGPIASGGQCIAWLHTHTSDGVIHIESPTRRIYTLGNLFDVWRQPLSAAEVGLIKGPVTAYVNGRPWGKDPRLIPLQPHTMVQLDVGGRAPFIPVSFAGTNL